MWDFKKGILDLPRKTTSCKVVPSFRKNSLKAAKTVSMDQDWKAALNGTLMYLSGIKLSANTKKGMTNEE